MDPAKARALIVAGVAAMLVVLVLSAAFWVNLLEAAR